jgi:predicted dehydrogenase
MAKTVSVGLVGICGYGSGYLNRLMDEAAGKDINFCAAIARRPERSERIEEIRQKGIGVYSSLEDFYAKGGKADIIMISSPIQVHCQQSCFAMEHGSHVLCEKPISATVQEAFQIMEVEKKTGKFCAIGYQWSFSDAIQALKKDIMAGVFGKAIRLKSLIGWPRDEKYYGRNDWAGGLKTADGDWILDSPINNANAHFLHNSFYVLGPTRETSAMPVDVTAELYRANKIQNFDTGVLRTHTDTGVEIVFYSTHAVPSSVGPVFHYQFEKADIYFDEYSKKSSQIIARFKDGSKKMYGSPEDNKYRKIWDCVEAARQNVKPACCAQASTPQILCINGLQDSMPEVVDIPKENLKVQGPDGQKLTVINGLMDTMIQCYEQSILFSEHGEVRWSKPGKTIDLRSYKSFPGGK